MRREGLLTGKLWKRDAGEMVKVRNKATNVSKASGRRGGAACHDHPVGKAMAKTKGRRNKLALSVDDDWPLALSIDDDWPLATASTSHRNACGAKVKVTSSHDLEYDLDDAYAIYAACRAIDVACGAKGDDIDAACHAIDVACAFDIAAACHAIDIACAVTINDVDDASDSHVDHKLCLISDDINLARHVDDDVVDIAHDANHAFDDSSCDDAHDHENYDAHDIHHVGDTTIDNDVSASVSDNDDTEYDKISDASSIDDGDNSETSLVKSVEGNSLSSGWYHVATLDKDECMYSTVVANQPLNDNDDTEYDKISDASSIDDGDNSETSLVKSVEGNSLSSGWYHVATLDKDEWYLC